MSTISPDEIVDLIAALKTRHDGLELRLCDANARELRERLLTGDLEVVIYALPGEELDERTHVMPLFAEQMVIAVHRGHRLAGERAFPVRELNGECYIHRMNCEFAGYADHILNEKGVTCTPTYWSERDDWTLAMVAAGLGFAFMPEKCRAPSRHRRAKAAMIMFRSPSAHVNHWRRLGNTSPKTGFDAAVRESAFGTKRTWRRPALHNSQSKNVIFFRYPM